MDFSIKPLYESCKEEPNDKKRLEMKRRHHLHLDDRQATTLAQVRIPTRTHSKSMPYCNLTRFKDVCRKQQSRANLHNEGSLF